MNLDAIRKYSVLAGVFIGGISFIIGIYLLTGLAFSLILFGGILFTVSTTELGEEIKKWKKQVKELTNGTQ